MGVDLIRHIFEYETIKELHEPKNYPIQPMCAFLHVSRSAYYRWLKQPKSAQTIFNEHLADLIRYIHEAGDDKGSIIITTNLTFDRWDECFDEPTLTGALVDCLAFQAHVVDMRGESYRIKKTASWISEMTNSAK